MWLQKLVTLYKNVNFLFCRKYAFKFVGRYTYIQHFYHLKAFQEFIQNIIRLMIKSDDAHNDWVITTARTNSFEQEMEEEEKNWIHRIGKHIVRSDFSFAE